MTDDTSITTDVGTDVAPDASVRAGSTDDRPRASRGPTGALSARNLDLRMSAIGAANAEDVFVQLGAVGAVRSEQLDVELGSVGAALAGEAHVSLGVAGSIASRDAYVEQSFVRTLIAQRVIIQRPSGVLVMIAQHVSGEVRPVVDWKGALAAGAAIGVGLAVSRLGRDWMARR
jgi:hypothetical protein